MRAILFVLFLALPYAGSANSLTEISVRTETRYYVGSGCDPEIVALLFFDQAGNVSANCKGLRVAREWSPSIEPGNVTVQLGGVEFTRCKMATVQRNHYPGVIYSAWGFMCPDSGVQQ